MKKTDLSKELKALGLRKDLLQKEIAGNANIPLTTANGYFTGQTEVPIVKAIDIAESSGDDLFVGQLAHEYLGYIKTMDGALSELCSIAELNIYQRKESDERKANAQYVNELIVESKVRTLDNDETAMIKHYGFDYLDEIILEVAIVAAVFEIAGTTMLEAIRSRMPEWKRKNYMRG